MRRREREREKKRARERWGGREEEGRRENTSICCQWIWKPAHSGMCFPALYFAWRLWKIYYCKFKLEVLKSEVTDDETTKMTTFFCCRGCTSVLQYQMQYHCGIICCINVAPGHFSKQIYLGYILNNFLNFFWFAAPWIYSKGDIVSSFNKIDW